MMDSNIGEAGGLGKEFSDVGICKANVHATMVDVR